MKLTLYLNERERYALRALANARHTSESYIIRLALRKELGLPINVRQGYDLASITTVTSDTSEETN